MAVDRQVLIDRIAPRGAAEIRLAAETRNVKNRTNVVVTRVRRFSRIRTKWQLKEHMVKFQYVRFVIGYD